MTTTELTERTIAKPSELAIGPAPYAAQIAQAEDELSRLRADAAEYAERAAATKAQLIDSRRKWIELGERSDPDWIRRAEIFRAAAEQRAKAANHDANLTAQKLKQLRVAQNQAMGVTRERLFIDAARTVLDRETFLRLWQTVDDMAVAG